MKLFRKPNPWFTIFFISAVIFGPLLLLLHIISFGAFNGLDILDKWAEYTIDKDINCRLGD